MRTYKSRFDCAVREARELIRNSLFEDRPAEYNSAAERLGDGVLSCVYLLFSPLLLYDIYTSCERSPDGWHWNPTETGNKAMPHL